MRHYPRLDKPCNKIKFEYQQETLISYRNSSRILVSSFTVVSLKFMMFLLFVGYKDVKKKLPKMPVGDCLCSEAPQMKSKVPSLVRLSFDPEDPPRCSIVKTMCKDQKRADDDGIEELKSLPMLRPSSCPPFESTMPCSAPEIYRLPKFRKEDKVWKIRESKCNEDIPRSDSISGHQIKRKVLPQMPVSDCPCLESMMLKPDIPPLHKLAINPIDEERKCIVPSSCNDTPRSDAISEQVEKKVLPKITIGECACTEAPPLQPEVPLLRRLNLEVAEDERKGVRPPSCKDIKRADDNLVEIGKMLPTMDVSDCPCVEEEPPKYAPKLRRLPKVHKQDKIKKCTSEDKCTTARADDEKGPLARGYLKVGQNSFIESTPKYNPQVPLIRQQKNEKKGTMNSKQYCTYVVNSLQVPGVGSYSPSFSKNLSTDKDEKRQDPRAKSSTKCPKLMIQSCKPAKNFSCKISKVPLKCSKKSSPFPSYSERVDEEVASTLSECDQNTSYLQPKNPITKDPNLIKNLFPKQGKIDHSKEERCIINKFHPPKENSRNCQTLGISTNKLYELKKMMSEAEARNMKEVRNMKISAKENTSNANDVCHVENKTCKLAALKHVVTNQENVREKKLDVSSKTECKTDHVPKKCDKTQRVTLKDKVVCKSAVEKRVDKANPYLISIKDVKQCPSQKTDCADVKSKLNRENFECKPIKSAVMTQTQTTQKSIWQRVVDYFRARPNCPAPDQWKKDKLRRKAEKAAAAAGLQLCECKKILTEKKNDCKETIIHRCSKPKLGENKSKCKKVKNVSCPMLKSYNEKANKQTKCDYQKKV